MAQSSYEEIDDIVSLSINKKKKRDFNKKKKIIIYINSPKRLK
jgi:hypothetical protein